MDGGLELGHPHPPPGAASKWHKEIKKHAVSRHNKRVMATSFQRSMAKVEAAKQEEEKETGTQHGRKGRKREKEGGREGEMAGRAKVFLSQSG